MFAGPAAKMLASHDTMLNTRSVGKCYSMASAPVARVGRPVTDEIVSKTIQRARLTAG